MFDGEAVPASEKVVSLFEPHTSSARAGARRTRTQDQPEHRAQLVDVVVESGNPAVQGAMLRPTASRQRVSGGSSRANLVDAKKWAWNVMFHKKTEGARHDSFGMDLRSTEAHIGRAWKRHFVCAFGAGPLPARMATFPGVCALAVVRVGLVRADAQPPTRGSPYLTLGFPLTA